MDGASLVVLDVAVTRLMGADTAIYLLTFQDSDGQSLSRTWELTHCNRGEMRRITLAKMACGAAFRPGHETFPHGLGFI